MRLAAMFCIVLCVVAALAGCPSREAYDVLIFGSTPAGFASALAAKNASGGRASVLLLEPTAYVGR